MELSPADRLGVQNDALALARAGVLSTDTALRLLRAFAGEETNLTVWLTVVDSANEVMSVFGDEPLGERMRQAFLELFRPVGRRLGWHSRPGESDVDALLRGTILRQLVLLGDEETIRDGAELFQRFLREPESVDANVRAPMHRAVVATGQAGWDQVLQLYRRTDLLQEERVRCLTSLGATSDQSLIDKTLSLALSDEVLSQNVWGILSSVVAQSGRGRDAAWAWFKNHLDPVILSRFANAFHLARIAKCVTESFSTQEQLHDVETFFAQRPIASAERSIKQALESIRSNVAWRQRERDALLRYFS